METQVGDDQKLQAVNYMARQMPELFAMAFWPGVQMALVIMKVGHIEDPDVADHQQ